MGPLVKYEAVKVLQLLLDIKVLSMIFCNPSKAMSTTADFTYRDEPKFDRLLKVNYYSKLSRIYC